MTTASANMSGAIGTASAIRPYQPKGRPWMMAARPVRFYDGETAETAEAFAAVIADAFRAKMTAERARPAGMGYDATLAPVLAEDGRPGATAERVAQWHADQSAAAAAASSRTIAPDPGLAELAERFRTRDRAESAASVARLGDRIRAERAAIAAERRALEVARMLASSGPVLVPTLGDDAPSMSAPRATVVDYSRPMPAGFVAVDPFGAIAEPAETVPDALALCNACELRPMVGPGHPAYAAGYCAECYAETAEPEPAEYVMDAPHPLPDPVVPADALAPVCASCADRTATGPDGWCDPCRDAETAPAPEPAEEIAAQVVVNADGRWCVTCGTALGAITSHPNTGQCHPCYMASVATEPAPAPVLAAVPAPVAPAGRPTCERCGQSFRRSGIGLAWHLANRPDCAARRLAVVA